MKRTLRLLLVVIAVGLLPPTSARGGEEKKGDWGPLQFLVGDWVGGGGGQPGQGEGEFTFHPDLEGRVLVRKSYAAYPATQDRPASRHEDLMVVYRESEGGPLRAIYFDNEGHVIRYAVTARPGKSAVEFLSEASTSGPRFRLTYAKTGIDSVDIAFEIAPPGEPDAFSKYIDAKAKRR
jgi:hypothetical protein